MSPDTHEKWLRDCLYLIAQATVAQSPIRDAEVMTLTDLAARKDLLNLLTNTPA